ncbi:zinc-ribbon domain-containing protein [Pontibacillus yanchengensis]|uniref:Zinc-ribbon domain-containing protein n=2 Tax=Pontibacillus yanchengensis TaxID=462910 RepID=A0A6I4ZQN2_9BACI|nr:zinc ribbon domain-containing protein [Pontibacillus yanchengensis]MYL32565.1 zinc-ribbon domain-containing protein [Pontibacillus yanchengensis]MYL54959.1 zinc-ribbon domain-containing protein [Pontibacillus yanchengensis]
MSLMNCPACDNQVSPQAKSCPKCGHPLKPTPSTPPPVEKKEGLGFWGVVGAVVVAIIILSFI